MTNLTLEEEIKILEDFLIECRNSYYNEDNSIPDDLYDQTEKRLRLIDPNNKLLTKVGSEVRGGKVELPIPMGSLDQEYDNDLFLKIQKDNMLEEYFTLSAKADGTSIELIYDNGNLYSAFSRGDGYFGADVTRHAKSIKSLPKQIKDKTKLILRGEVIFRKSQIDKIISQIEKELNKKYANGRALVAGQMNSESAVQLFYESVEIVVYEIMNLDLDKNMQLEILKNNGFNVVMHGLYQGKELTQEFLTEQIKTYKLIYDYQIDGIVIDINKKEFRNKDYKNNLNPKYAKKFKVLGDENQAVTTVERVEWNASKDNYWKPLIHVRPVQLDGVIVSKCTGFNAKFIIDNGIGKGAIVLITRQGDVIPYCKHVIHNTTPTLPEGNYEWCKNKVELICMDYNENSEIQTLLYFFTTLGINGAKIGNVTKLFEIGVTDYEKAIMAPLDQYVSAVGNVAGNTIYNELHKKLQNCNEAEFAGAIQVFGRGIGVRKLTKLVEKYNRINGLTYDEILNTEGFADISAEQVYANMGEYARVLNKFNNYVKFEEIKSVSVGEKGYIVFTGVRDKDLEKKLIDNGYQIGDSISRMTILVAKDPNGNSNKITKAKSKGIKVLSLNEAYEL